LSFVDLGLEPLSRAGLDDGLPLPAVPLERREVRPELKSSFCSLSRSASSRSRSAFGGGGGVAVGHARPAEDGIQIGRPSRSSRIGREILGDPLAADEARLALVAPRV